MGAAGIEFLAVLVPGVYPVALAAGESVASSGENLTHTALREGVQPFALGIVGVDPTAMFDDVERFAVGDYFPLGGAEGVYLFAVFVIDVIP